MNLKNPFTGITDQGKLVTRFKKERAKALNLQGNYSVKKVNWLIRKLERAQITGPARPQQISRNKRINR